MQPADERSSTEKDFSNDPIVVLITAGSSAEAEAIARRLVETHLAACVNILPQIRSLFWWEGKVSEEQEILLLVKSRRPLFDKLAAAVQELHSYTVPEVIALPIQFGTEKYLQWIGESTRISTLRGL